MVVRKPSTCNARRIMHSDGCGAVHDGSSSLMVNVNVNRLLTGSVPRRGNITDYILNKCWSQQTPGTRSLNNIKITYGVYPYCTYESDMCHAKNQNGIKPIRG